MWRRFFATARREPSDERVAFSAVARDCVGKSHLSWKGIEDGLPFVAYAGLPGKIPLLAKVQVAGLCVFP